MSENIIINRMQKESLLIVLDNAEKDIEKSDKEFQVLIDKQTLEEENKQLKYKLQIAEDANGQHETVIEELKQQLKEAKEIIKTISKSDCAESECNPKCLGWGVNNGGCLMECAKWLCTKFLNSLESRGKENE